MRCGKKYLNNVHIGYGWPLPIMYWYCNVIPKYISGFNLLFIFLLQNVLRELEQKKPQLDDLVKTAENLRESPIRQQIPEKGKPTNFEFVKEIIFCLSIIWTLILIF